MDALAEFKVKTYNYSAEFGRSAGTIISATTKSGTNRLHGGLWEFVRNEKFDANNFFSNAAGAPSSLLDVPPTAFRTGDFSTFKPKIYDPRSRVRGANGPVTSTPFPNNQIPGAQFNPGAVATLALIPQPNFGAVGAGE